MTPDEIANRGFASAFRGISETEVRTFLKRVADEVALTSQREDALRAQIRDLEEQLRNPVPLTEQQLLDALGEETARVLRSAQEAAEDIRSRAEERAATLVREAQEEATRLREQATTDATARTEEAERVSTEREAAADAYATRAREDAERDATETRERAERDAEETRAAAAAEAEGEIEAAKESGRGLVQEARAVRERILGDLGRRRTLLQAQVDELRAGRDRLLDAYRVVKRTLGEATDALALVEARAETEPAGAAPPLDVDTEAFAAGEPTEATAAEDGEEQTAGPSGVEAADSSEPPPAAGEEDSGAAVDALFARLRAEKPDAAEPEPENGPEAAAPAPEPAAEPEPEPAGETEPAPEAETEAAAPDPEPAGEPEPEPDDAEAGELEGDDARRAERAAVLDPLATEVTRKAKRTLQDEQNELLDRMRQVKKGRPEAEAVLPSADEGRAAWVEVLSGPITAAYRGGWEQLGPLATGRAPAAAPDGVVAEHAAVLVEPLRERLVAAIDDPADDDDEVTQRVGARFREFKAQELEAVVGDVLALAWARGTYDAAPAGTRLRWVPTVEGKCPDCDDNALEPTVRGEPFPTGQPHPPAHPGCRCLLVPADA
jgi:DivIVA domain-containing protein